jgi:hypothetical protein
VNYDLKGGFPMIRRILTIALCVAVVGSVFCLSAAQAQEAYGRQWAHTYNTQDWNRFYHYPYVYYPQNFWGTDYYRSSEDLYYRYPPEMRIPVYNKQWQNYYPGHREDPKWALSTIFPWCEQRHTGARYHKGHHFIADVF